MGTMWLKYVKTAEYIKTGFIQHQIKSITETQIKQYEAETAKRSRKDPMIGLKGDLRNGTKEIREQLKNFYKKMDSKQESKEEISLLENKKQIILHGPPGTGKTYIARKLVVDFLMEDV